MPLHGTMICSKIQFPAWHSLTAMVRRHRNLESVLPIGERRG